jgi:hypothetical protein
VSETITELYAIRSQESPEKPELLIYQRNGISHWLLQLGCVVESPALPGNWSTRRIAEHFIDRIWDPNMTLNNGNYEPIGSLYEDFSEEDRRRLDFIKSELQLALIDQQKELFVGPMG